MIIKIDDNFLRNKWKYIRQVLIVTVFAAIILVFFDFVVRLAVAASLGATCFIIFTVPHKNSSQPRYILGGYFIGAVVGSICSVLSHAAPNIPLGLWGAIAIGISMFFMVIFNFEHPPASALSLGIVIGGFSLGMIITVFSIALCLLGVRRLLRKWLIDLI